MKFNVWTLLFQIVNFIVLLVILRRILYKPVREIMLKRRGVVEKEMQDAERTKAEALGLKTRFEKELEDLRGQKERKLEEMQSATDEERTRLLSKAREDAEAIVAREKALLVAEKARMEAEIRGQVIESAALFSTNIIQDLADEPLREALFRKFLTGAESFTPLIGWRKESGASLAIEIVSSAPLADDQLDKVRAVMEGRTGRKVTIEAVVDPALIAGVRMKVEDQVYDASLAGQIIALKQKLREVS